MAEGRRLDGAQLEVDGRDIGAELYARLLAVRVEESVHLPDRFSLLFEDQHFRLFDRDLFKMGSRVQVSFRAEGDPVVVTSGEVTAISVEPGEGGRHCLAVTGLDLTHRLLRGPKTRTFQRMSDADVAARIAREQGLDADVDRTGAAHDHLLQASETDYAFLRRRADLLGFDLWVTDRTLHFKRHPTGPSSPPVLRWGGNLQRFKVRFASADSCAEVQVRAWDPLGKRAVDGSSGASDRGTDAPAAQQMATAARRGFGAVTRSAVRFPVADAVGAESLAQALSVRASGTEVVLRGEAAGDPALGAGSLVRVEQVGSRLAGSYRLTTVEHVFAAGRPYVTRFVSGGKEPAALVDLTGGAPSSTAARRGLGGLVVGVVTNNDDPEGLGRVKVELPALSEDDELNWARLVSPGGGAKRGLQAMPEVGDEVLVGFEHDDLGRPLVLGGLWSRTDLPPAPDLVSGGRVDGRVLASRRDHRLSLVDDPTPSVSLALGDGTCRLHLEQAESALEGDRKLVVTATEIEVRATSSLSMEGAKVSITATGALTLSGKPIRLN